MDGLTIRNGQPIGATPIDNSPKSSVTSSDPSQKSFADTLKDAVGQVNTLQKTADKQAQDLATGKTSDIPEVMMAAEKADIALRLMTQVRNKIISAYEDVMKMQV